MHNTRQITFCHNMDVQYNVVSLAGELACYQREVQQDGI